MAIEIQHIEIVNGRAKIIGKKLGVVDIYAMYVLNASPIEWIIENYNLTPAEVHAALAYYYDHTQEIEQALADDDTYAHQHGIKSDELLKHLRSKG